MPVKIRFWTSYFLKSLKSVVFLRKLASGYLNVFFSKHRKCFNTWNFCLFRLSFLRKTFYMFFREWLKIKKIVEKHFFFFSFFLVFTSIFVIGSFSVKLRYKILSFVNDCFCFELKNFNDFCSYLFLNGFVFFIWENFFQIVF